jgi:outer membrane receptor protein involved in Fe transport
MKQKLLHLSCFILLLFCPLSVLLAGTTGKISGTITDEDGIPIIGAQVYIDGTTIGSLSDLDGNYNILNVKPGTYTLVVSYLGYATSKTEQVKVNVDQTTRIDAKLREATISGEEVVVTAVRPIVEKGQTTTTAYIDAAQIEALPITSINEAINNQAGVVDGHFRGGRIGEVAYLVNGVPINNAFNNNASFEVEQNMVSSLEVISGVFNAEYGQALSGVVNIVTKGVSDDWSASVLAYTGGFVSNREQEFVSRNTGPGSFLTVDDFGTEQVSFSEASNVVGTNDVQLSVGGPLIKNRLGIQTTVRYFGEEGHLLGRDLFRPSDLSFNVNSGDPESWIINSNGSGDFEAVNYFDRYSLNTSLVFEATSRFKIDYNLFLQQQSGRNYDHSFKYNPTGINKYHNLTQTHILGMRYAFGDKTFANLSYSLLRDEGEFRLYDDPSDPRYVDQRFDDTEGAFSFNMGGNYLFSNREITTTHTVVADITSQLNNSVLVKAGFSTRLHDLDNESFGIRSDANTGFLPERSDDPFQNFKLDVNPYEFAVYAQTKIEYDDLIVNAGIRYDYFQPDFVVTRDWTQAVLLNINDPANPGQTISNRIAAQTTSQFSPRFGIAFPISDQGVLRFSAGLFFQTPQLNLIFQNAEFERNPTANPASFGNANLKPERTLSFEIGLQQGITKEVGLELTLFSKDIRNLTGAEFGRATDGQNITRFINLDYGTIKGTTFSLYQQGRGPLSWTLDYTLQFATGSASNPAEAFNRFQSGLEQIIRLQRVDWDRRHVLNTTFTYNTDFGLTISNINNIRTGTPYTTQRNLSQSFIPNNQDRPLVINSDFRFYYKPPKLKQNAQLFVQIDNAFDTRVHNGVYSDSGLATESVFHSRLIDAGATAGGLNSIQEFYRNAALLGPPRSVLVGLSYKF